MAEGDPARRKKLEAAVRRVALKRLASLRRIGSPIWAPHPENLPQNAALASEADETLYGGSAGCGKLLSLDTLLPTPQGWTTMGEVAAGDWVLSELGRPVRVVGISDVEVPSACYRLTLDDGAQIEAGGDHRWLTFDVRELGALTRRNDGWRAARRKRRKSRVTGNRSAAFTAALIARNKILRPPSQPAPTGTIRTTDEIAATLTTARGRRNHAIPVTRPLDLPRADLPLDPYLFGLWLGDGSSYKAEITTADAEIKDAFAAVGFVVRRRGEYAYGVNGGLLVVLRGLGVLAAKHIPDRYLRASAEQRLALVQGLMDTDGYCQKSGACEFTTTKKPLADGMVELLASLGVKARAKEGRAKLYGRDCGPKWRISFSPAFPAFRLARKLERQSLDCDRRTKHFRYVVACDRIPAVPMRCIAVDSDSGLYLAGRAMVPTHNSDLLLGVALTQHKQGVIYRKQQKDTSALIDRGKEIAGDFGQYVGGDKAIVTNDGRHVYFDHCSRPGDEQSAMGKARDFFGFDELAHFSEYEYVFMTTWNRSADPKQRCRIMGASNPPLTAEGMWMIRRWAPWLDPHHPKPAASGELRWFATIDGKDTEVAGPEPFEHTDKDGEVEVLEPRSRTFIPGRLRDNPYYARSAYKAVLQSLPEPQRSALWEGKFTAAMLDDASQVIPTAWIDAAMARWVDRAPGPMDAMGVDPARGGLAKMVLAPRHGDWYAPLISVPGSEVPTGPQGAAVVIRHLRDGAVVQIDNIGVGASVYDHLQGMNVVTAIMDARHGCNLRDRSGTLPFQNMRAYWWWAMREALDPETGDGISLPVDSELKADLAAPTFTVGPRGVKVEAKDDIEDRLKRSVDKGDAVVMALPQMKMKAIHRERLRRPKMQNSGYRPHRWTT